MLLPQFDPADVPELTAAEIEAMAATVARVKAALAEIVERERQRSQGLISGDRLTREGLDVATQSLGIPTVSDEEWHQLRGHGFP